MMLLVRDLAQVGDIDARTEALLRTRIKSETTRDQSVTYGEGRSSGGAGGSHGYLTGDAEIDALLERFMGPVSIGLV